MIIKNKRDKQAAAAGRVAVVSEGAAQGSHQSLRLLSAMLHQQTSNKHAAPANKHAAPATSMLQQQTSMLVNKNTEGPQA